MHIGVIRNILFLLLALLIHNDVALGIETPAKASDGYIRQVDKLSALGSFYKHTYISNGRVIGLDENGITTSEGQGYAMLRAVWSNDRSTFISVWNWTLFAWKWKDKF